ncbi:hypothetical protein HDA32_003181 [Spinactinospora alkalitolerans]|uniref:PucR family transcriptional regulator n=1 Tax=Spinactinospora alkalitolerans TaxID=687207 RepID=A0A852TWF3_9ACTN|nr:PucR family transcriptional regulator [Spinactinospora alkalitolerans]NYE48061.1 hypothetical protein [Spinactinospora alkalitolerans]
MSALAHGGDGAHDGQTVPLRTVVERRGLGLRVLVPPPGPEEPRIRWAVVSELPDPVPYLNGRELLLTAGVDMSATPAAVRRYVTGLVEAGVSVLGFGVTPVHDAVPPALIAQCRGQGLPLLEVPGETPFVAVGQAVGEELERLHVADVRRLGEAHRALAKAVTAAAPTDRAIRTLSQALDCWVALVGDRLLTHARSVPALTDEVTELIAKLRAPHGPRSAKARMRADEVFLHAVGEDPRPRDVLLLGRPTPFGMTDRAVLGTAVALLGLLLRSDRRAEPVPGRLLTRLLLETGRGDDLAPLLAELVPGAGATLRVLRACWAGRGAPPPLADPAPLFGTGLVEAVEGGVRAVVADLGAAAEHLSGLEELRGDGWLAALSGPARPAELPAADRQASSLLVRARAMGEPLVWPERADPFSAVIDAERARAAARSLLGPLSEDTDAARSLRETLRAWLARHGNWDRAAADLGSHRNSVRYRIGRIERDLHVDLTDPEHRMRLWFALSWLESEGG